MMKKSILFLFLILTQLAFAQNINREFVSVTEKANLYEIVVNDGVYNISFYSPTIVQTTFIPNSEKFNPVSHAVVLNPVNIKKKITQDNDFITIETDELIVKVQKKPFQIAYYNGDELLISEKNGYIKDSLEKIQFNITKEEMLYGAGARALEFNRRGYRLQLYNRAHYGYETHSELMNYTMPVVVSSKEYLLHFDNPAIGFLDLDSKKDNTLSYETISGRKTYQVVIGNSWTNLVDNYTQLTGRQPMLPRWALGNFSSRFGYHTQKEVLETIQKFRDEKIPVDAIILDLYWFSPGIFDTMGKLAFLTDSFPEPQKMIDKLRDENVETILITEPFILTTSERWDEAVDKNILCKDSLGKPFTYKFYFGNTGLIDIYSKKGFDWFKDIYNGLLSMKVTGMWGDLGEPEVHPSDLLHATGTADQVHNIYGHDWCRLVYEAFREFNPDMRPFILMRAAYSGTQHYGIVPWTGDVNRTWGGLQSQPAIALEMGLQGIGYMHSDLGGFAGPNLDDELYARWLQYGVFQPIYRPHAQEEVPSEPVFRSDKAKSLAKAAIELRYKMLPYNYNLFFQNHLKGTPLMRPLFFEEPDNKELYNYTGTYLWGNDFLVAPVLKRGQKRQEVYFPKTSNWFDFYTDEKYKGGQTVAIITKEKSIPTYVRGGAIIPLAKPMQSTKEYDGNDLVLHFYFDDSVKQSESDIYNDDGLTFGAYEKEMYEILKFISNYENSSITVTLTAETGKNYLTSEKSITLIVHNITAQPKKVYVDGKKSKFLWNEDSKTISVNLDWNTAKERKIQINL